MKHTFAMMFLLAGAANGISAQETGAENLVTKEIIFSEHIAETVTDETIEFNAEGFRFLLEKDDVCSSTNPAYSERLQCLRFAAFNKFKIYSLDGHFITKIEFEIQTDESLYQQAQPYIWGSWVDEDCGNAPNSSGWEGRSPFVTMLFEHPDGKFLYISSATITYESPEEKQFSMELSVDEVKSTGSNAIMNFMLKVNNDNGVRDFTITAHDSDTGKEYCSYAFDRNTFADSQQNTVLRESDNDENTYELNGQAVLDGLESGQPCRLNVGISANYADGSASVTHHLDAPVSVTPSTSTGITDVQSDTTHEEYYDMSGVRVQNPQHGAYIRRQGSATEKILLP